MDGIGAYIFSVICGAAVCGIVMNFFPDKSAQTAVLKLMAGGFLAFTVLNPLLGFRLSGLGNLNSIYDVQAADAVNQGKELTRKALAESIKTQCESYIKNKAEELNLSLDISVSVSEDDLPVPISARITGEIAPYKKTKLTSLIEEELGIAKEAQTWT